MNRLFVRLKKEHDDYYDIKVFFKMEKAVKTWDMKMPHENLHWHWIGDNQWNDDLIKNMCYDVNRFLSYDFQHREMIDKKEIMRELMTYLEEVSK